MDRYLLVMLGGGCGAMLRYAVGNCVAALFPGKFPLGTLIVNVTGCFLIGFIVHALIARVPLQPNFRILLVVGVLGGYTTFSSFAFETFEALKVDEVGLALLNAVGSVVLGLLAVWLGELTARFV
ncbi:MAG: fluoride efflux transporter CrcB [Bdellovibrionota bacterium]